MIILAPGRFRPIRVLGLLLAAVLGGFSGFVFWQILLPEAALKLNAGQWLVAVAALTAVIGWMSNGIVTVRNSVKQHTVNTLLQSRLSTAYTQKADVVSKAFSPQGQIRTLTKEQFEAHDEDVRSLIYCLNYLEYIALGIRHGDLDEDLMRGSVRGFVIRLSEVAEILLCEQGESQTYEHLKWLLARWKNGEAESRKAFAKVVFGYVIAFLAAAIAVPLLLDLLVNASGVAIASQSHSGPFLTFIAAGIALLITAPIAVSKLGFSVGGATAAAAIGLALISSAVVGRLTLKADLNVALKPEAIIKVVQQQVSSLSAPGPQRLAALERFRLKSTDRLERSDGTGDDALAAMPQLAAAARSWLEKRKAGHDGVLLVIGSADRLQLAGEVARQFDANSGLAQARGEAVKNELIRQCHVADQKCDLSPEKVIVLVAGPRETNMLSKAGLPAGGYPLDRRVDVWAFWTRASEAVLNR